MNRDYMNDQDRSKAMMLDNKCEHCGRTLPEIPEDNGLLINPPPITASQPSIPPRGSGMIHVGGGARVAGGTRPSEAECDSSPEEIFKKMHARRKARRELKLREEQAFASALENMETAISVLQSIVNIPDIEDVIGSDLLKRAQEVVK